MLNYEHVEWLQYAIENIDNIPCNITPQKRLQTCFNADKIQLTRHVRLFVIYGKWGMHIVQTELCTFTKL